MSPSSFIYFSESRNIMTNTPTLFVTDLDGTLLQSDGTISSYSKDMLNQLIQDGALITAATGRSGATAAPLFEGVSLSLPLITLNGSALFDIKHQTFEQCQWIPYSISQEILNVFRNHHANCLTYTIKNQKIQIYYDDFYHDAEREFYKKRKDLPLKTYLQADLPVCQETIYFSSIQPNNTAKKIKEELLACSFSSQVNIIQYDDVYHTGYSFLELYAKNASKRNAVLSLAKQIHAKQIIVFGDNQNDLSMMKAANRCFAVSNAADSVKKAADEIIGDHNQDAVVKKIADIFYSE